MFSPKRELIVRIPSSVKQQCFYYFPTEYKYPLCFLKFCHQNPILTLNFNCAVRQDIYPYTYRWATCWSTSYLIASHPHNLISEQFSKLSGTSQHYVSLFIKCAYNPTSDPLTTLYKYAIEGVPIQVLLFEIQFNLLSEKSLSYKEHSIINKFKYLKWKNQI